MIDATFLKSLTKDHPTWMASVALIGLDGEQWYAATNGAVLCAVKVSSCEQLQAVADPKVQERLHGLLTSPATQPIDYAAFKAWVGSHIPFVAEPCDRCDGKGRYDCHCDNACCQGYVNPCDYCDGKKTTTSTRPLNYASLGDVVVDRTTIADAFAFLDASEVTYDKFVVTQKSSVGFIFRSENWRVAFMQCTPDEYEVDGEPFPLTSEVTA